MPTPLATPLLSFPTPNPKDWTFVEFVDPRLPYFEQLEYGDLYPDQTNYPGARLTYKTRIETAAGMDERARLVWCSSRSAQEVYNARITYTEGNTSYPIYQRHYLFLRSDYQAATPKVALKSLIRLTLVAGGINYKGDSFGHVPLVFTGGGGSGAKGFGVERDGVITTAYLTNGGDNYTSVPTVSALVGSGLNVMAVLQGATALLVKEQSGPAEGELLSLWVQAVRVYETLPGPEIAEPHYDEQTGTERTHYRKRVVAGTAANPVASVQIAGMSVASPTTISTNAPHDLPTGVTHIRIAGVIGGTPSVGGDYDATRTGTNTFTIAVNVTVAPTANTGYMSPMKDSTQIIIESVVKLDEGAGSNVGTLLTVAATLPGREFGCPQYDVQRGATVDTLRQAVHFGRGTMIEGTTYHGQTVEDSQFIPQGTAFGMLVSKTILLPGDAIGSLSFDEENGAVLKLFRKRVALATTPITIGSLYEATRYVEESRVIPENTVVGVLQTLTSTVPDSFSTLVSHNEPMPKVFTFITGWLIPNPPFSTVGPYLGVNYTMDVNSVAGPAECLKEYTVGRNVAVPPDPIFEVISGQSRFFPISGLTLHDAYSIDEINGISTQTIEDMPVSVPAPSAYNSGDPLVVNVTERPLRHPDGIWIRETYTVLAT